MITNDARWIREVKSWIAMAKAAFRKEKIFFCGKLYLKLIKNLLKCYIWSKAL